MRGEDRSEDGDEGDWEGRWGESGPWKKEEGASKRQEREVQNDVEFNG